MKLLRTLSILALPVAAFLVLGGIDAAFAQGQPEPDARQGQIGILDIEVIRRHSKMTQDMDRQIAELRTKLGDEVKAEEAELRKAAEELERQRVIVAPEAYTKSREELRQRTAKFRQEANARSQRLNAMRGQALKAFQEELNKAVRTYARANRYFLILSRRELVFFERPLDITPEVIKLLDQNVPSYQLTDPAAGQK